MTDNFQIGDYVETFQGMAGGFYATTVGSQIGHVGVVIGEVIADDKRASFLRLTPGVSGMPARIYLIKTSGPAIHVHQKNLKRITYSEYCFKVLQNKTLV